MSIVIVNNLKLSFACAAIMSACAANAANPISGAIGEWKPIIDTRLRYEWVEQAPATTFTHTGDATTLRARLGVETGKAWSTALLVEGEFLTPIENDQLDAHRETQSTW